MALIEKEKQERNQKVPSPRKEKVEDKVFLLRYEELLNMHKDAKTRVDQRWYSNPYYKLRQNKMSLGLSVEKPNFVQQNKDKLFKKRNLSKSNSPDI